MKEKSIIAIVFIFMAFVSVKSVSLYLKEQSRANRLENNLAIVRETAEQFRTKDGHTASKLKAQELTIQELRRVNPDVISQFKNLYIPPRLAQSYTEATQEMKVEVKAAVKDSIPERTGTNPDAREPEKIQVLKYRDKWISIKGILDPDTAKITVLAKDTIFTAIYKGERRHPWAWILSKRQLTAAATNRSPYIDIKVIQAGVIKK